MQTRSCEFGGQKILVVEDDETVRTLMVRVLREDGYRVVSAADADRALEACAHGRFQAVVTDYELPGMNGIELAKAVTRTDASVKVLVAAACPGSAQDEHRRLAGAGTILGKPFSASDLRHRVHAMLDADGAPEAG